MILYEELQINYIGVVSIKNYTVEDVRIMVLVPCNIGVVSIDLQNVLEF